jgi:putative FmdB family regulatory protein
MPIYCYECSFCKFEFEEFAHISDRSTGKTDCPKCANVAFKIPAIFSPKIFKPREFADGTKTPEFVRTYNQEKAWLKSQGITYDKPTGREKANIKQERKRKAETSMQIAFKEALNKTRQGFKIEGLEGANFNNRKIQKREVKPNALRFKV